MLATSCIFLHFQLPFFPVFTKLRFWFPHISVWPPDFPAFSASDEILMFMRSRLLSWLQCLSLVYVTLVASKSCKVQFLISALLKDAHVHSHYMRAAQYVTSITSLLLICAKLNRSDLKCGLLICMPQTESYLKPSGFLSRRFSVSNICYHCSHCFQRQRSERL